MAEMLVLEVGGWEFDTDEESFAAYSVLARLEPQERHILSGFRARLGDGWVVVLVNSSGADIRKALAALEGGRAVVVPTHVREALAMRALRAAWTGKSSVSHYPGGVRIGEDGLVNSGDN